MKQTKFPKKKANTYELSEAKMYLPAPVDVNRNIKMTYTYRKKKSENI